jgi:dipeptidase E
MAERLLLLSSSRVLGGGNLEYALDTVREFLDGCESVLFAPFARNDWDAYTRSIEQVLGPLGKRVIGLHTVDTRKAVESDGALFVGGGNSFRLLTQLQRLELIEPVMRRVASGGLRYMGASAGTNMACPTLRTTNDMPIVQPASFDAFDLIPFQINPHFPDDDRPTSPMGETRTQRIEEFLQMNDVPVLGMREGAMLSRTGDRLTLGGTTGARLFRRDLPTQDVRSGADLSWLLEAPARFHAQNTDR